MSRLRTDFWVGAYLNRLGTAGIPAFVTARGNSEAGSVLVRLNTLDGQSRVYQKSFDLLHDREVWDLMGEGEDADVDGMLQRQMSRDRDLWIIEVEDRQGRTLLDEAGLERP